MAFFSSCFIYIITVTNFSFTLVVFVFFYSCNINSSMKRDSGLSFFSFVLFKTMKVFHLVAAISFFFTEIQRVSKHVIYLLNVKTHNIFKN